MLGHKKAARLGGLEWIEMELTFITKLSISVYMILGGLWGVDALYSVKITRIIGTIAVFPPAMIIILNLVLQY